MIQTRLLPLPHGITLSCRVAGDRDPPGPDLSAWFPRSRLCLGRAAGALCPARKRRLPLRGPQSARSAPDVAAAAAGCPAHSVRVLVAGTVADEQAVLYSIASGLPVETFTPVGPQIAEAAPWPGPDCPVVAWVEHGPELPAGDPADPAVAATLLGRVGITADPAAFRIERHRAGFVVYRRQ